MSDTQNNANCPEFSTPVIDTIGAQVRLRQGEDVNDIGFLTRISREDFEGLHKNRVVYRMGIILVKGKIQTELTLKNTDPGKQLDTTQVIPFARIDQKEGISDLANEDDYLFRTILTDVPDGSTDTVTIRPYMIYKDGKGRDCKPVTHYGNQIQLNISVGK